MVALARDAQAAGTEMSRSHYYKPMLALAAEKAFTDSDWIFEIKLGRISRNCIHRRTVSSAESQTAKNSKGIFPNYSRYGFGKNIVVDGESSLCKKVH